MGAHNEKCFDSIESKIELSSVNRTHLQSKQFSSKKFEFFSFREFPYSMSWCFQMIPSYILLRLICYKRTGLYGQGNAFSWKIVNRNGLALSLDSVLNTRNTRFECVFGSLQALKVKSLPQNSEISTTIWHTFQVFLRLFSSMFWFSLHIFKSTRRITPIFFLPEDSLKSGVF